MINNYHVSLHAQNYEKMLKVFIFTAIILAFCIVLLSVRIIFVKNGRFVKTHVSSSKAMRERGVTCVQSQDYAMRHRKGGVKER